MVSRWTVQHELKDHKGPVHCAVYNSNGNFILTGGQDRRIMLWNAATGNFIAGFEKHAYEVLGICPTHDNARFASCGGDKDVLLWDVKAGIVDRRFTGHTGRVNAVAFNSESSLLVSGSYDASVRLWDTRGHQRMPIQILQDAKDSITSLVVREANIVCGSVDGHARWYDLRAGELRADCFDQPVTSITLSHDANSVLVSTLDSQIRLMDGADGSLLQAYSGHLNKNYRIKSCLTYDEAFVLAGDEAGRLWEWHLETGKASTSDVISSNKTVLWVAAHPTRADAMVTSGADGVVRVWSRS